MWQSPDWPNFTYNIKELEEYEAEFLKQSGMCFGAYTHISEEEKSQLKVELLSEEALKTSKIEGELLNRDSIQLSICRQFGLECDNRSIPPSEQGISAMMADLFNHYDNTLSNDSLYHWHKLLMNGRQDLQQLGQYRAQPGPTQVVSGPMHNPKIHFEAPPSQQVPLEMNRFINWFNATAPKEKNALPSLTRAGIAHLYFVLIHPFEDGNGRIARALAEKSLAQNLAHPTLIALAYTIERNRKEYYFRLEKNNKICDISDWLKYFSQTILNAQQNTLKRIEFIIAKKQLFDKLMGALNPRQEKALLRMFAEGIDGFKGGLSAENYISITQTTKATATRDLQDLVQKGALTKQGKLRYTRYYLNHLLV
tara:strand:+ start:8248 stop:9348 length:1101 start_codon:yes stop_codon:yes gene_type:complete